MSYGFGGHIGMAKESGWGSGTPATDYVEALSENFTLSIERFQHKNIIASLGEPDDTAGLRRLEGSITFAAHPTPLGHFLKMALQTKSLTTVLSGSLYQNDFFTTAGGADFSPEVPLQPYSFEIYRDVTTSVRYAGCLVNGMTMTIEPNNAVMCEARMIGKLTETCSKTVPTFPGSPTKPFTFDTASLSIGGAATQLVETLTIEINNNLTGFGALNQSFNIAKVRRTDHQMVTLRGTADFASIDEYLQFVNQSERPLRLHFTKADSFALDISIPRMVYTAYPLGIPGKERLTVNFEGKGYVHQGSGHAIRIQLTTTSSLF